MRAIIDTNVFVSGIFFHGPPYAILDAWRDGRLKLIVSPAGRPVITVPDTDTPDATTNDP